MKIEYSKEADAIYVYFKEEFVEKSMENRRWDCN